MNKKGFFVLTKEILKMIYYAFFIVIIAFLIIWIFSIFIVREVNTSDLENHLIVHKLLVSDNCLAYSDGTRVFPGIINLDKFNEERLNNCLYSSFGKGSGVKLDFYYQERELSKSIELNGYLVAQYPLCGLKNSKVNCYSTRKYVLYLGEDGFEKGILDLVVISKDE